jgi:transcription antitermination protein NusB
MSDEADQTKQAGKRESRRKARELALNTMYAYELGADDNCIRLLSLLAESAFANTESVQYARLLVGKAQAHKTEIDELLRRHAKNWDLVRMAAIDRNVLRVAVAELRYIPKAPYKVVIDEAVEIAKTFGADASGKFVNGILDAIYKDVSTNT